MNYSMVEKSKNNLIHLRNGFTLIEMLVVVAVIGILSSVVLTALGPARDKAKDTRIQEELAQVPSFAETLYDGDYDALPRLNSGDDPANVALLDLKSLAVSIKSQGGELIIQKPVSGLATKYLTYSNLNAKANVTQANPTGDTTYYCRDSNGRSGTTTRQPNGNEFECQF